MSDPRLAEAGQRRLAEDFAGARGLCDAVLAEMPDNAEAMAIQGVCALETGDLAAGSSWLDRAEAADPANASAPLYRSIQHEMSGNLAAALEAASRAATLAPGRFDVQGRLGDVAGRAGVYDLAGDALSRALEIEPQHPAAAHLALMLAAARLETGDFAAARKAARSAETGGLAGSPDLLRVQAMVSRQLGDWVAMSDQAGRWLAAAPDDEEARGALALALGEQGYYRRAVEIFRPVVDAHPGDAENWAALGRLMIGARDMASARSAFQRALSLDDACAEASFGLARIETMFGHTDEAIALARQTLEHDPAQLEAYGMLCELTRGALPEVDIERLQAEIDRPDLAVDRKAIGLFALGDCRHAAKQRDAAFAAWRAANSCKHVQHTGKARSAYDRGAHEARVDRLIAAFDEVDTTAPVMGTGPTPVFIVGMPRSGTTLLEAALAAHEDVVGGGELSAMIVILAEFERWAKQDRYSGGPIPEARLEAWRARYLGQYEAHGLEGARWVTDKQPSNFLAIGLIRQMFPDAPVLHIRRKPVETAFSIYRRNFSRMWPFAHDLGDIAHYYAHQARIGDHWARHYPGRVTTIQYEDFVRDFEDRLRYILARTRIGWSRACLEFYKQDRAVMTFSALQVRRAPSPQHLDSTTPYRDWLGAFDDELSCWPVDPDTGAWTGHDADNHPHENADDDTGRRRPSSGGGIGAWLDRLRGRARS
ncbi:tetratricopeptide repeat-containing sulfotransferase family protein [Maricaulis maris]|uniref:Tetratricopeptide repeat protein n=1 Tax=Maricaulis maris TaxID=74318 RepID=A0A495DKR7_9PROT|nr:tetratricopeptide repeat-containing sulfotransferase family protein [Maricaulis maris]RKR03214.1 tetratricopeptide repeat protein [Maricaulis maris]